MTTTAMVRRGESTELAERRADEWSRDQLDLIKRTLAKGSTDDEFNLFIGTARRLRLDPFAKQIWSVPRWDNEERAMVRQTQVSIDGLRLIAERTERYRPDDEDATFKYTKNEKGELLLTSARVRVFKRYEDGWHPVPALAFFDEYAGYTKDGKLTKMWREKPHIMLAKCAEAMAIRKAFPHETSGAYVPEEFAGDVIDVEVDPPKPTAPAPLPSVPAPTAKPVATKASPSKSTATPEARAKFEAEAARQAELDKKAAQPDAARAAADLELDKTFGAPQPAEPKPNSPADIGFTKSAGGLADPGDAPAPGPKPEDLTGDVAEVDKVKVALSEVLDLNALRALDDRWKALTAEDRKWCATEYFAALLRIIHSGPFADLDGAGARLNGMKKTGAITPAEYERGSEAFLGRQKAGK